MYSTLLVRHSPSTVAVFLTTYTHASISSISAASSSTARSVLLTQRRSNPSRRYRATRSNSNVAKEGEKEEADHASTAGEDTTASSSSGLTLNAAKRILAPHLYPLAQTSPWQEARASMKKNVVATTNTAASSTSNTSPRRPLDFLRVLSNHWLHRLAHLLQYGLSSEGNSVNIYFDGDDAFEAMFLAISQAKTRVCIETFMWKPDRIGLRMIELLEQAAERGCQVLVLYDDAGSFSLFSTHLSKLAAHPNAHVVAFNPVLGALFRTTNKDFSHRTHRKILIADSIAFAGGMNTSEQYAGPRLGINEFRDTHMRVVGPGVEHLAEVFYQSLQEAHAHDRTTWRRIWRTIKTRTAARVTSSSTFNAALDMLAESGTKTGTRAAEFFEKTRSNQKSKLELVEKEEKQNRDIVKMKEAKALGIETDPEKCKNPHVGSSEQTATPPSSSTSTSSTSTHPPQARETFRTLRSFISHRLHVVGEASSTPLTWSKFQKFEQKAQKQWKKAWKRVYKNATANGGEGDVTSLSNAPSQNPLTQSAMSALASSLTTTNLPAQCHMKSADSPITRSSTDSTSSSSSSSSTSPTHTNVFLQVLPSNTIRHQFSIQNALVDVLNNGLEYILITNPFLVPPPSIKNAIINAGKRGVTVRIITGGKSDTPYMRWSSNHIYHQFLLYPSISIYEYETRILHAKTVTIDGLYSSIGSFNLDFLSSHKLLEVNLGMLSADVARQMERQYNEDIKECKQVTKESLKQRSVPEKILHWAAYHCSRAFYSFLE